MKNPREWYIEGNIAYEEKVDGLDPDAIVVIEKSAYDELKDKYELLREQMEAKSITDMVGLQYLKTEKLAAIRESEIFVKQSTEKINELVNKIGELESKVRELENKS